MDGILRCNVVYNEDYLVDNKAPDEDRIRINVIMREHDLIADHEIDCYIREGYGAFMVNVIGINAQTYIRENLGKYIDKGYKIAEGPAAPDYNGNIVKGIGLYCINYLDLLQKNPQYQLKLKNKSSK